MEALRVTYEKEVEEQKEGEMKGLFNKESTSTEAPRIGANNSNGIKPIENNITEPRITDKWCSISLEPSDTSESSKRQLGWKARGRERDREENLNRRMMNKLTNLERKWLERIDLKDRQMNEMFSKYDRINKLLGEGFRRHTGSKGPNEVTRSTKECRGQLEQIQSDQVLHHQRGNNTNGDNNCGDNIYNETVGEVKSLEQDRYNGTSSESLSSDESQKSSVSSSSLSSSLSSSSISSLTSTHSSLQGVHSQIEEKFGEYGSFATARNQGCGDGLHRALKNEYPDLSDSIAKEGGDDRMEVLMERLSAALDRVSDVLDDRHPHPCMHTSPSLLKHYNDVHLEQASKTTSTTVLQAISAQLERFHSGSYKDAVDRMLEKRWHKYFGDLPKPLPLGSHLGKYLYNSGY